MQKILIVEDEQMIVQLLIEELKKRQFKGRGICNFQHVFEVFKDFQPDLVLMDINLPVYDGFYWCQKIREVSNVPLIFLSSRNTNMDMVTAMNMGGDDFITKPFSLDVLIAKIKALLRRSYDYTQQKETSFFEIGSVKLNVDTGSATVKKQHVDLSKNEYKLLYLLMEHKGTIMSREKLLRALWEDERFVDDNTLTVNINRLRKKIEAAGEKDFIQTKIGKGYMIV